MAKPWRRALRRDASRPASERGPVLFLALLRLAAICRSDGNQLFRCFTKLALDDIQGSLVQLLRLSLAAQANLFQDCVTPQFIECDSLVDGVDVAGAAQIC